MSASSWELVFCKYYLEHATLDENLLAVRSNTRERVKLRLEDESGLTCIQRNLKFLAIPFDGYY